MEKSGALKKVNRLEVAFEPSARSRTQFPRLPLDGVKCNVNE
jgi:hypothetical protein